VPHTQTQKNTDYLSSSLSLSLSHTQTHRHSHTDTYFPAKKKFSSSWREQTSFTFAFRSRLLLFFFFKICDANFLSKALTKIRVLEATDLPSFFLHFDLPLIFATSYVCSWECDLFFLYNVIWCDPFFNLSIFLFFHYEWTRICYRYLSWHCDFDPISIYH